MKLALLVLALTLASTGCAAFAAAAPVACKGVSVLNDACMLLTFVGADGKPHQVSCSGKELQEWGGLVEHKHHLGATWTASSP